MKILIAVDDTKSAKEIFEKSLGVFKCMNPEEFLLVYVEQFEGRSLMTEMLGDAEMSTLREVLEGTEYKEALDEKAEKVLNFYKTTLETNISGPAVRKVLRSGQPADEILKTAKEEGAGLIVVGSMGNAPRLLMSSVSREVANSAEVPVLIVK